MPNYRLFHVNTFTDNFYHYKASNKYPDIELSKCQGIKQSPDNATNDHTFNFTLGHLQKSLDNGSKQIEYLKYRISISWVPEIKGTIQDTEPTTVELNTNISLQPKLWNPESCFHEAWYND